MYRGQAIKRSRQPDLGDHYGKGPGFDLAQGRISICDCYYREPLLDEGLLDQGTGRLVALDDKDLLFDRIHFGHVFSE